MVISFIMSTENMKALQFIFIFFTFSLLLLYCDDLDMCVKLWLTEDSFYYSDW